MGSAPFRVWALVRKSGGYVTWTANPWHFTCSTAVGDTDLDGLEKHRRRHEMAENVELAQPMLERFVRGEAGSVGSSWSQLKDALLQGRFDAAEIAG
jgi:hypothetical protein